MKLKLTAIALMCAMLFSSCATLFTGTKDRLAFNTNPSGAMVYIDGLKVCETPCETSVKRSLSDKMVEFKLDGYKTQVITLDKEFNIISLLNLGGLVGWVVDAATGSIFKYGRKAYDIDLELAKTLSQHKVHSMEIDTENKTVVLSVIP